VATVSSQYGVVDRITLEVIQHGLISIAREMGLTLLRTSYSPILNEGKDFSTAVFDVDGNLVAQMEGCPIHMASMGFAVKTLLETFASEEFGPHDIFILNDPYRGGMQLQDITLIAPIHHEGRLLAFAGVRAHHADVGGKTPGSCAPDAVDQYQEGLVIPPMKLISNGNLRTDIMELILSNVRFRRSTLGDLQASQAAIEVGRAGLDRLASRYGHDALAVAMAMVLDHSERLTRKALSTLQPGTYEFVDYVENELFGTDPIRICVAATLSKGELHVDFTGTSDQVPGPFNITYSLTCSAVGIALLMVADPQAQANDGCMRPLTLNVPPGSVLDCRPPAPIYGGSIETTTRVIDTVLGALSSAVPSRICAGEFGSCNATFVSGTYPGTQERFLMVLTPAGGWGGTSDQDGWTTTDEPVGNCRNQPVEYLEYKYPIIVEEYSLDTDSAGAGRTRGGLGHIQRVLFLSDQMLSTVGSRSVYSPYGLFGGWPGATNAYILAGRSGTERLLSKNVERAICAGDRLTINTGGGGGYGKPEERPIADVIEDIRGGYCSHTVARDTYRMVLASDGTLDTRGTERLRQERSHLVPPQDGGTRPHGWVQLLGERRSLSTSQESQALMPWWRGASSPSPEHDE